VAKYAARYAALVRTQLPERIVGAYMCPWTPGEYDGALRRIFAQDYALLAPAIDVFTPLIYAKKSGRASAWGRELLDQMNSYVPWESRTGVRRSQRGRRLLGLGNSFVPQSRTGVRRSQGGRRLLGRMDSFVPLQSRTGVRRSQRGRRLLDRKDSSVLRRSKIQLILDVLDFPDSLIATAEAAIPSWGLQMFGGAQVFEDPEAAGIFRSAIDRIRQAAASQHASA